MELHPTPSNRNDYAFLVKSVDENRNLTWHVKPTSGPIALSNTYPNKVIELPDCVLHPLPVELTRFEATVSSADASKVVLSWTTASEKNSERFDVEGSNDGSSFSKLGTLAAAGTSASAHNYEFMTISLNSGTHYFRLKQVDLDATTTYSPVRAVNTTMKAGEQNFTVSPNPANSGEMVSINADGSETAQVVVYDMSGKIVMNFVGKSIDTSSLQPGMYFVKTSNSSSTAKLIIK